MVRLRQQRVGGGITNSRDAENASGSASPQSGSGSLPRSRPASVQTTSSGERVGRPRTSKPNSDFEEEAEQQPRRPRTTLGGGKNFDADGARPSSRRWEPRASAPEGSRPNSRRDEGGLHFGAASAADATNEEAKQAPEGGGRPGTSLSVCSLASSVLEEMIVKFQKNFQDKNDAKFARLADIFRVTDINKSGKINKSELMESIKMLDVDVDERVIDRLMSRCEDPEVNLFLLQGVGLGSANPAAATSFPASLSHTPLFPSQRTETVTG